MEGARRHAVTMLRIHRQRAAGGGGGGGRWRRQDLAEGVEAEAGGATGTTTMVGEGTRAGQGETPGRGVDSNIQKPNRLDPNSRD